MTAASAKLRRPVAPPLSPVLLAGLAVRPLPPALLQPALDLVMALVARRHPGVFERLAGLDELLFRIDPVDLPFVFLLRPDPARPSVSAVREHEVPGEGITATIHGPLLTLIDLLEGRIDGDALFFSRELVIEGDTEAVVALRNAVDGAEISVVDDFLSALGPLAGPARHVVGVAGAVFERARLDLETLRAALIAPAMRRADAQAAELHRLEKKVGAAAAGRRAPRTRQQP